MRAAVSASLLGTFGISAGSATRATIAATPLEIPITTLSASAVMPPGGLPVSQAKARELLNARLTKSEDPREKADLRWVLTLADRYGGRGQPRGRRATVGRTLRVNAWWYSTRHSPASRVVLRDSDGIISTYREFHGFMVNPVATIGRWRGLNRDVPNPVMARLISAMAVDRTIDKLPVWVWEYFDVADNRLQMRPGVSGMAQSRAALLFSQSYRQTGDPAYARAALKSLNAFRVPVSRGGVESQVSIGAKARTAPWYVERAYPGQSPWKGAALNGFMVSLLDLERVSEVLGRPALPSPVPAEGEYSVATVPPQEIAAGRNLSAALVDEGLVTLQRFLPVHDTGSWSFYGLLTGGRPWRHHVADLNYHCYHILLLNHLESDFPGRGFGTYASKWAGYVKTRALACPAK